MSAPLDQLSAALDASMTKRHPHAESIHRRYVPMPDRMPCPEHLRAHFLTAIQTARNDGFPHFAEQVAALYNRNFSDWIREKE